jgi:hypothetical protein
MCHMHTNYEKVKELEIKTFPVLSEKLEAK